MPILKCEINSVEKDSSMVTMTQRHPSEAPDITAVNLAQKETVSHGDTVEIFRSGTIDSYLLLEQWDVLGDWVKQGAGTSEIDPAGQLHQASIGAGYVGRQKTLADLPTDYTVELRIKFDDFGLNDSGWHELEYCDGIHQVRINIYKTGIYCWGDSGWQWIDVDSVTGRFYVWRFIIDSDGHSIKAYRDLKFIGEFTDIKSYVSYNGRIRIRDVLFAEIHEDYHRITTKVTMSSTRIFKGILEMDEPSMSQAGVVMEIKARQEKVRLWRKYIERNEDPLAGGFWGGNSGLTGPAYYYPNKIIEFYLHPSKSDAVGIGVQHRSGWGIRPDDWTASASATGTGFSPLSVHDRLNTIIWNSGKNQEINDYFQIDLGSTKSICAIRVENRKDEYYIRNYEILVGTSLPPVTQVASKSNNVAHNIVESWTPQNARYIRIRCTSAYATLWSISEIFIYESKGEISGISVGQMDEHAPLNEAIDLPWIRRTEAIEAIVGLTETAYVPWEFWVEDDGQTYFKSRRGSDKSSTILFVYGINLETDRYKKDSMKRGDMVKVLGKGKGHDQDIIASEWVGSGDYEKLVVDRKLESKEACTAKANIIHNESQNPIETVTCQVDDNYASGTWGVGDDITLVNAKTGLSGSYRVKRIVRKGSSGGEVVTITASSSWLSLIEYHTKLRKDFDILQQQDDRYSKGSERDIEKLDATKIYPTGQYNKYYEAEEILPTWSSDGNTVIVEDSDASDGVCIKRLFGAPSANMWAGPYETLSAGSYYALFRIKMSNKVSTTPCIRLDVFSSTLGGIVGQLEVSPSMLPEANTFHTFGVAFELQSTVTDIEYRGMSFESGYASVFFDWVGVVTRDTPIATAGVTLTEHAGTDTDEHGGTDTDEHGGTDTNPHGGTDTDPHTGTDAASSFAGRVLIEDWATSGSKTISAKPNLITMNSGTFDTESDATNMALVYMEIKWLEGYDECLIRLTLEKAGTTYQFVFSEYFTDWGFNLIKWIAIPANLSGYVGTVEACRDGVVGTMRLELVDFKVYQYMKHTHTMADPDLHLVTQPDEHLVTDPINHLITQPDDHIVTDPDAHTTESDHEH